MRYNLGLHYPKANGAKQNDDKMAVHLDASVIFYYFYIIIIFY